VTWRAFIRYWLPGIICVGGILAMILGPEDGGPEGGAAILGAGLSIYLINILFRVGAQGDEERDEEASAREFYAEHGFWPDERPPRSGS
jgi:hypothetical protein